MSFRVDPTGHFRNHDGQRLIDALGLLPAIIHKAFVTKPRGTAESVYTAMVGFYGFGNYRFASGGPEDGTVDSKGVYKYPEDEPLFPLAVFDNDAGVKVYVYQYAIIAVVDERDTIVSRMD